MSEDPASSQAEGITPQLQKFKGVISEKRYARDAEEVVYQLEATLNPGDRVVINGNQEVNPELGTMAGQPILASAELTALSTDAESKEQVMLLVKITDPDREDVQEMIHEATKHGVNTGEYFIAIKDKDTNDLDGITFLPEGTSYGLMSRKVGKYNLEWLHYNKENKSKYNSPISSEHIVVASIVGDDVALLVKEGSLNVKTLASEEQQAIVANENQSQEPIRRGFLKTILRGNRREGRP
jgi:hypothetical protein